MWSFNTSKTVLASTGKEPDAAVEGPPDSIQSKLTSEGMQHNPISIDCTLALMGYLSHSLSLSKDSNSANNTVNLPGGTCPVQDVFRPSNPSTLSPDSPVIPPPLLKHHKLTVSVCIQHAAEYEEYNKACRDALTAIKKAIKLK